MLTISDPIHEAGKGDYYLSLAKEDYYLKGGEPPGIWHGKGAEEFDLKAEVTREQLQNLLSGKNPDGRKILVQNQGEKDRRSAYDLTFSAPKSVSVAWSQSKGKTRKEIELAHNEAVKKALTYLENNAGFTRRGKKGHRLEAINLTFAMFQHGTSRAQDPQLHTHCLLMNLALRHDGTSGSIESFELFRHKMVAGALYRAELSAQLEQRLSLRSEQVKTWFELSGVPKNLIKEFSKRRTEIEKVLKDKGYSSAIAAKIIALDTRSIKGHISRSELFKLWEDIGKSLGWSEKELNNLVNKKIIRRDPNFEITQSIELGLKKAVLHHSHFTKRELVRYTAEASQGRAIGIDKILSEVDKVISSNKIISLGRLKSEIHYTTPEILKLEKELLESVKKLSKSKALVVSDRILADVFRKRPTILDEQKEAITHITANPSRIQLVSGMAGTGKSYMLDAAREAWERQGFTVYGMALAGKASEGIYESAGIKSNTIYKSLIEIQEQRLKLNSKSIILVDEAGMVGTEITNKLVKLAVKSKARLVLVGDNRQLQPIEAGGAFQAIAKEIGEVKLIKIKRQKEAWAIKAVHNFADGDASQGLEEYAKRGHLTVSECRKSAMEDLIKSWQIKGLEDPKNNIILASTNQEVDDLNEKAQKIRIKNKFLGERSVKIAGQEVYEKEKILFTKNSALYGVKNGTLGTIKSVNKYKNQIKVELQNGKITNIDLKKYQHLKLGYALTINKAQGLTTEDAYVLLGGTMQNREVSYVQVSRAKGITKLFTDKLEAGENLNNIAKSQLAKNMSNSREKSLASTILEANKVNQRTQRR